MQHNNTPTQHTEQAAKKKRCAKKKQKAKNSFPKSQSRERSSPQQPQKRKTNAQLPTPQHKAMWFNRISQLVHKIMFVPIVIFSTD